MLLPPKNTISLGIFRIVFYETGHFPDTKTVDNISQGISCGSRVIFGYMYWPTGWRKKTRFSLMMLFTFSISRIGLTV